MRLVPCLFAAALFAAAAFPAELRFCMKSDPKTLDPFAVTDQASDTVRYLTSAALVRRNRATQKLESELAAKWELRNAGRLLVFRLRDGLRFHDGTPATSADARAAVLKLLDEKANLPAGEALRAAGIESVDAPNPLELHVKTSAPVAGLESLFEEVYVVSTKSPLGAKASLGPFVLTDYKRGHSLAFERNPNYFRKDPSGKPLPKLDAVRIDIQPNPDLERARFQKGEIHFLQSLDPETFALLEKSGLAHDAGQTLESEVLWFNQLAASPLPAHKKQWFRSREFRLAVSHAVNRADLVRVVYGGRGVPGVSPVTPASKEWFNPAVKPHAFDRKAALDLLAKAGFKKDGATLKDPSGNPVTFSLITNAGNRLRARMAAMIQADLAQIGIQLNVVTLDMPSLLERMTRSANYEAILLGLTGVDLDPNDQMNIWMSSSPSHSWNPAQKQPETPWEAEIDKLLNEQFRAASPAKRKQLLGRFQQIVSEQAPMLFLVHPHALMAVSPELKGVKLNALRPRVFWNIEELSLGAGTQTLSKNLGQ
jgi:peptide/nickel transport system substrate-binding protein